jgi:glycosyltransferase involved in cell wall biosynthesis
MVKGGAQENTLATAAGMDCGQWESCLATGRALGPEGSLEPECVAAGVRMLRVPGLVREVSPWQDGTALRQLVRLMQHEQPHLVHTHTSKAGILGRIAARRAGVPVVLHTPHGHVFHSYGGRLKTQLFVRLERACAPLTDRLIALTESEQREHEELGIGRLGQWTTVHSGVDFGPFRASREQRQSVRAELGLPVDAVVLGTVGRLVPVKGQRFLIDAFARVAARYSGLHLLLVGDGPLREELAARARSLGLGVRRPDGESVPCTPAVGTVLMPGLRHDVPCLLSAMDIFVLPSLNEGMGRVLVEAMAMELPCVASRVSGIQDVVEDRNTGILVPPRDPDALAQAVRALLECPDQAREMGRRGRRKVVPEFSRERMIEKLQKLYRDLLQEKGISFPPAVDAARQLTTSRF